MSAVHPNRDRFERSKYRRTNAILLAALIVYLGIALERERVPGRPEIYPFSAWSLFSMVPNESRDYSVRLVAVRGQPLAAPLFLEDAAALYPTAFASHAARMVVQQLGRSTEAGDAEGAMKLREMLETLYLHDPPPTTYELVARRYDPLERYRQGRFRELRRIATYQSPPHSAPSSD